MVSHWCLSDSRSSQVSRTFLSILADLSNAVVWIVSTRLLISKSSSPFINPSMTLPRTQITVGTTITFMLHSFSVLKQGLDTYLSFRFLSVLPCDQPERHGLLLSRFCYLLTITRSGRLAKIVWTVCIYKKSEFSASHFLGRILGCAYTICSYDQIEISYLIPSGLPCQTSHV